MGWGLWAIQRTPLDALPDLSDTQVIIRTQYPGQAPQIVEDQVTYPLATTMMSVPGAKNVRGYSFFGDSFVYVLFEDGTDLYWARSRVLEYLNQVQGRLPARRDGGARARMRRAWAGSSSTRSSIARAQHDLGQLRALQDWFLKYELKAIPDVAEVASIGGMVRQYQVVLDPERLRSYNIPHTRVVDAIRKANQETGGSVVELAEAEYMVRARGYLTGAGGLSQHSAHHQRQRRRRSGSATSRWSRSVRRRGAGSPSSTARAKWPAASSSCAAAATR